jgi:SAM-dependent methyltransferase
VNTLDHLRALSFDVIHNVDTRKRVPLSALKIVGENKSLGHMYFPTLPKSMKSLLKKLDRGDFSTRTFVDVGCGKGLTLLIAADFAFRKVTGVEFSPELASTANKNIKKYLGRTQCKDVSVQCLDATEFKFPNDPLLVYFFNPFQSKVMEIVLRNLRASIDANLRPVTVVCDQLHDAQLFTEILRPTHSYSVDTFAAYDV